MCYYRISLSTGEDSTGWNFVQKPSGTGQEFARQSTPITDAGTTVQCIAFQCPSDTFDTDIITSVEQDRKDDCIIFSPGSANSKIHRARVAQESLQAAGNGIFASQAECESSSEFFVQYSCDGVPPPPSRFAFQGFLRSLGGGVPPGGQPVSSKRMSSTSELEQELAKILGETIGDDAKGQTEASLTTETVSMMEPFCLSDPNLDPELVDLVLDKESKLPHAEVSKTSVTLQNGRGNQCSKIIIIDKRRNTVLPID